MLSPALGIAAYAQTLILMFKLFGQFLSFMMVPLVVATIITFAPQAHPESVVLNCTIVDKSKKNGQRVEVYVFDEQKKTLEHRAWTKRFDHCQNVDISAAAIRGRCRLISGCEHKTPDCLVDNLDLDVEIDRTTAKISQSYIHSDGPPGDHDYGSCRTVKAAIP